VDVLSDGWAYAKWVAGTQQPSSCGRAAIGGPRAAATACHRSTCVARTKERSEAARDCSDDEDGPRLEANIDNLAGRRERVRHTRRNGQQLHGAEKGRITESVDIPAFLPALKNPYKNGANGEDHKGQSERKQQAREQPTVPFLSREEPRQFFSYHSAVSFRPAQLCEGAR
jgi:hypothetical protein